MPEAAPRRVSAERAKRYAQERQSLVEAGYRYLGRPSRRGLVLDVLEDTGLSTRAFYRHFTSRDDLVVAMFEQDSGRMNKRLRRVVEAAESGTQALQAYATEYLKVAYRPQRAQRSRALSSAEAYSSPAVRQVAAQDAAEKRAIVQQAYVTLGVKDPARDAYGLLALLMRYTEDRLLGLHDVPFEVALNHCLDVFVPRAEQG